MSVWRRVQVGARAPDLQSKQTRIYFFVGASEAGTIDVHVTSYIQSISVPSYGEQIKYKKYSLYLTQFQIQGIRI